MKKLVYVLIVIFSFFLGVIGTIYFYDKKETHITYTYNDTSSIKNAIDKVYDSVVIVANYKSGNIATLGTGFIYKILDDKTIILTNYHVVKGNDEVKITDILI